MCRCGKPTINGQPGYCWNGRNPGDGNPANVYPVNPPALAEGDTLIHDEPGRCGGIDSHSYHFRVVQAYCGGGRYLLVRHGGGDARIRLRHDALKCVDAMDSTTRYWMLQAIYHLHSDAARDARDAERSRWAGAAAQKRIKLRRRNGRILVEITPPVAAPV